ncbi:YhcN/YlaJ family sporulation lipoprotein [Brevibacillus humidisoli]|uniref:YhcN/YlaJ family sporulation lipoprotein n=1 Tax=Brevibacillus humidisoli TaxID=2895522 RepID=UPI001E555C48|nr:YhcN/YlaJ family sporulation lipoprotein [Brevibacillus humidisoli]UFJ39687.1 YhcN/YlaJ family sporulation lipoprotein [Brevibacillus humidisoli]
MTKRWLYGMIASFALLVSACGAGNNAAPDYTNNYGTTAYPAPNGYGGTASPTNPAGEADTNGPAALRNGQTYQSLYKAAGVRTTGIRGTGGAARGGNNGTTNMTRMGYVQVDGNSLRNGTMNSVYVDRDALAQVVGNVTAGVPGVNTSSVLVSDEEIFVGLELADNNRQRAASIKKKAKMNAWSVSPRYFKVYITDKRDTIREMARIASRSANVNVAGFNEDRRIDDLIHRFGGLTDGEDWPRRSGMTTEMRDQMDIGDTMEGQMTQQNRKR